MKKAIKAPLIAGGVLAGAGLAYVAVKEAKSRNVPQEVHIETSILINQSPEALFAFWREFTNLPLFMTNLKSVTRVGDGRSHWIAKGINGDVEWDAEVFNEVPNELIAWRTLDGDVMHAGSVRFERVPGRGTYVRVTMNYNPPAGIVGKTIAQLLGAEPKQLIDEDLRHLKQLLETGEIATIAGQVSGRDENARPIEAAAHA
jgi:uncharacterized membrane protein